MSSPVSDKWQHTLSLASVLQGKQYGAVLPCSTAGDLLRLAFAHPLEPGRRCAQPHLHAAQAGALRRTSSELSSLCDLLSTGTLLLLIQRRTRLSSVLFWLLTSVWMLLVICRRARTGISPGHVSDCQLSSMHALREAWAGWNARHGMLACAQTWRRKLVFSARVSMSLSLSRSSDSGSILASACV